MDSCLDSTLYVLYQINDNNELCFLCVENNVQMLHDVEILEKFEIQSALISKIFDAPQILLWHFRGLHHGY